MFVQGRSNLPGTCLDDTVLHLRFTELYITLRTVRVKLRTIRTNANAYFQCLQFDLNISTLDLILYLCSHLHLCKVDVKCYLSDVIALYTIFAQV